MKECLFCLARDQELHGDGCPDEGEVFRVLRNTEPDNS